MRKPLLQNFLQIVQMSNPIQLRLTAAIKVYTAIDNYLPFFVVTFMEIVLITHL